MTYKEAKVILPKSFQFYSSIIFLEARLVDKFNVVYSTEGVELSSDGKKLPVVIYTIPMRDTHINALILDEIVLETKHLSELKQIYVRYANGDAVYL